MLHLGVPDAAEAVPSLYLELFAAPPLSSATSTPSSTWGACPALPLRQCQGVILAWDQDGHLEWNLRMLD